MFFFHRIHCTVQQFSTISNGYLWVRSILVGHFYWFYWLSSHSHSLGAHTKNNNTKIDCDKKENNRNGKALHVPGALFLLLLFRFLLFFARLSLNYLGNVFVGLVYVNKDTTNLISRSQLQQLAYRFLRGLYDILSEANTLNNFFSRLSCRGGRSIHSMTI